MLFHNRRRADNDGGKYAYDISNWGLKRTAVPGEAETHILESPSRFTGLRQLQGNRIIAANNPIWLSDPGGHSGERNARRQAK